MSGVYYEYFNQNFKKKLQRHFPPLSGKPHGDGEYEF
jgi:hypothetical protein